MTDTLQVTTGVCTQAGRKPLNEDNAAIHIPQQSYLLETKGVCACVADGVSSAEAGQEASRLAVSRFVDEYYQTPDTWSVAHCGEKILSTLNLHLYRKSHQFVASTKGFLCTFSAIVLKGRTAHFFHVGDSRIYHLQQTADGWQIKQLTHDHAVMMGGDKPTLSRALGMDNQLNVDYGKVTASAGDVFLLTTDGIHDFISSSQLQQACEQCSDYANLAERLCDLGLATGSDDNVSAVVLRVERLPNENIDDYHAKLSRLPFPPELEPGHILDGYRVERLLFASARSQLYMVAESDGSGQYVMKTPSRNYEDDPAYIERFIQEEWIGKRIQHPNVVPVVAQQSTRTCLYYLMEYVAGQGLDQWIEHHTPPSPRKAIGLIKDIAAGLAAFHANEMVHQDLRPANIQITPDERAVILDFGSVYVAGLAEMHRPMVHDAALGTLSYSDPLYILGSNPGAQGDVYALATITYEMFTGELPYGDNIEDCRTSFDYGRLRYRPARELNPVIPIWFDRALQRGTEFDLSQRYTGIAQLMQDLQNPNPEFLLEDPVAVRSASSIAFWQILSGFWFLTLLLVIYLFSQVSG